MKPMNRMYQFPDVAPYLALVVVVFCLAFVTLSNDPAAVAQTTPNTFGPGVAPGLVVKRASATINASTTDGAVVAAASGKRIKVLGALAIAGDTATSLRLNTKGSGSGTAISPTFTNGVNGGFLIPVSSADAPWFVTNEGEALTATTGTGSATAVHVLYVEQ